MTAKDLILSKRIESRIYFIRGQKVMLDRDLAELYGAETKAKNKVCIMKILITGIAGFVDRNKGPIRHSRPYG